MSVELGPALAVPEGTHLLHIGPQKTGSTAIQSALHAQRDELRSHGVVYPGPHMRPVHAVSIGLGFAPPRGSPPPPQRAWRHLLEQLEQADGLRVCISHERFGRATDDEARRVVETLGGTRPHVVAVARRYDRLMPSQWQQRVKAGERRSYQEWLTAVLDPDQSGSAPYRNLWVPHDTVALMRRWGAAAGNGNLTLLVSDDSDRLRLFRAFEALLALPPGLLNPADVRSNRSFSYAEAELVREVNRLFAEHRWDNRDHFTLVHRGVLRTLMAGEPPEEDPRIPALPTWAHERLVELSAARVTGLRKLGIRVVGDLGALLMDPDAGSGDEEVPPLTSVSLTTASRLIEGALGAGVAVRGELARARTATAGQPRAGSDGPPRTARSWREARAEVRRWRASMSRWRS